MEGNEAKGILKELLESNSKIIRDTLTGEQIEAIKVAYNSVMELEHLGDQYLKTPFLFCMTLCHYRTGAHMGKSFGVVFADSEEDAENIVWDKYGGDLSCELWVKEVPKDGTCHTIYKNMI